MFIRGFRVARTFKILPKHLKAAGRPSPDSDGYDSEPDIEAVSIAVTRKVFDFSRYFWRLIDVSKYQDPLHILLDYIAEVRPTGLTFVFVAYTCRSHCNLNYAACT